MRTVSVKDQIWERGGFQPEATLDRAFLSLSVRDRLRLEPWDVEKSRLLWEIVTSTILKPQEYLKELDRRSVGNRYRIMPVIKPVHTRSGRRVLPPLGADQRVLDHYNENPGQNTYVQVLPGHIRRNITGEDHEWGVFATGAMDPGTIFAFHVGERV